MSLTKQAFFKMPYVLQNLAISLINTNLYRVRHTGEYHELRKYYKWADTLNAEQIEAEANKRLNNFLAYSSNNSTWYKTNQGKRLEEFPILEKKDILNNLDKIKTIDESDGIVSLTGGTTGASMKVIYTKKDMQERFAILDHFRAKFGYELGKKTAWFSGKNLITAEDLRKGKCSHYDYVNKIRFYSTFVINKKSFDVYWNSLNEFQPEFIVGFPSSVYELCKYADEQGLKLSNPVKVFFPTAETVLKEHRELIGKVMGCKLVDQYASSEGSPFILECEKGHLHIHPLTGVFEVISEDSELSSKGELLVTSFTTHGTPLIRYRVGDGIEFEDKNYQCECGSPFPVVKKIYGRTSDFVFSPEFGKVNLGNISNATKDVQGIMCFQIIQNEVNCIELKIVSNEHYDKNEESKFISALRERLGEKIDIHINHVEEISKEKSGKFRIVKNNLTEGEINEISHNL